MTTSCLYEGWVQHRRFGSAESALEHQFRRKLFMTFVELDADPDPFDAHPLWGYERRAVAAFRREDFFGDPRRKLSECVRDEVESYCGKRPRGPIRVLTHLRYLGLSFNPVSFFYCYSADDSRVETIVAEVTNTPWGERHNYVLPRSEDLGTTGLLRFRMQKEFHVSPFMPMDQLYDWRFREPGQKLSVHMENHRHGAKVFDASLTLERMELTAENMSRVLVRYPLMTGQVVGGIYLHALKLWLGKAPYFPHPHTLRPPKRERAMSLELS